MKHSDGLPEKATTLI